MVDVRNYQLVLFVLFYGILCYALLMATEPRAKETARNIRGPAKPRPEAASNPVHVQRPHFPPLERSWFEEHPNKGRVVDLTRIGIKPELMFTLRWRSADVEEYGTLNRGLNVKADSQFATEADKASFIKLEKDHALNGFASDLLGARRELHDARVDECKNHVFREDLPTVSIIICFHNELWSTLIRTVMSAIDRSPRRLLHEIILVDDGSEMQHLKEPLEVFAARTEKVKIVRSYGRVGLVRARLLGAAMAKGDVLLFLDSHCECTEGWLEPLLDRIAENRTTVAVPVIDIIEEKTMAFRYEHPYSLPVGGFDWSLTFDWYYLSQETKDKRKSPADPVPSPTMAGGLYAIDREYFQYLGAYDEGFKIWGMENLEISFRIWMCGGSILQHPCSRVGHVYRERSPYLFRSGTEVITENSIRVAEIWLDDYKKIFYDLTKSDPSLVDASSLKSRKLLRQQLKCHSFRWYLDHVYPTQFNPYTALRKGKLCNRGLPGFCIEADPDKPCFVIYLEDAKPPSTSQMWYFTRFGEIRILDKCLSRWGDGVKAIGCQVTDTDQRWKIEGSVIRHHDGACLASMYEEKNLKLVLCDAPGNSEQEWYWELPGNTTSLNSSADETERSENPDAGEPN